VFLRRRTKLRKNLKLRSEEGIGKHKFESTKNDEG
jgi:hypothetical protein